MNSNSTWRWIIVAAALFAFIFFFERHVREPETGPQQILAEFNPANVTSIQVRPAGRLEIRADHTNGDWDLTRPIVYPAQATAIETLLDGLENLVPATYISARELRQRPKFDEEYGFNSPQMSLNIQQGEGRIQILFGILTAPGDQVFLQVVGMEGVYVVDASVLKLIPHSANDWRDTALVDLGKVPFNHIVINNGGKNIELALDTTNRLWSMIHPLPARADSGRIMELVQKLHALRVTRFVTDDSNADLDTFGLKPPELEVSLLKGTNSVALLQFGKSPTNDASQIFARRDGVNSVVTVSKELVAPWRAGVNEFRDHRLLSLTQRPDQIEVSGTNHFLLQRKNGGSWRVEGENFPVDSGLVDDFINTLGAMQIVQFKDAVTEPDLPTYGLATPSREIAITFPKAIAPDSTNAVIRLSFGLAQGDNIFVRRSDEDSIYAVSIGDFQQLPSAGWQLRERRLWNFTEENVAKLTVRQDGKSRELVRQTTNSWSFASGSQGMINVFAVEETVHRFGELSATAWNAQGDVNREQFGFGTNSLSLTFDLKSGEKLNVELGGMSPSQYPYASTVLDGKTWVFEFPLGLYQLALSYLAIPGDPP